MSWTDLTYAGHRPPPDVNGSAQRGKHRAVTR